MRGTVKFFNDEKGYGFITPDPNQTLTSTDELAVADKDVFVHFSNIDGNAGARRSLSQGERVAFTVGAGRKGPEAQNVVRED